MKYKFVIDFYINGLFECHVEETDTKKIVWKCEDDEWNEYYKFHCVDYDFSYSGNLKDMVSVNGVKRMLISDGIIPEDSDIDFDVEHVRQITQ